MKRIQLRTALSALSTFTVQRPRWVVAGVIVLAALIWGISLYSIASQIGSPFPGFFYSPDRIVSSFTPQEFTGWQAGLRPWDRIVEVNGQHWREMRRLVREAGVGSTLVYTVERGNQSLDIPVPTMEFTPDILLRFIPGHIFLAFLFLAISIFVHVRNPAGRLNRYLLLYLLLWAGAMGAVWECHLSQQKWTAYLLQPWIGITCVAGWIFFWSFPADRARKEFLARWPLIPAFMALAVIATIYFPTLFFLASRLDRPTLWHLYTLSATWGSFLIFAGGCVFNKFLPPLQIALRKGTSPLIRQQAVVLLVGIGLGLSGFTLFTWAPVAIHFPPPANTQWGAIAAALYPLSVGYAVLRYQLFDIRVVVRKGLVYSLLTATLTAVFLLLSLLTGYLFQGLTGRQSLLVALFPALFVAALFQPARGRIQTFVDRAFFRREVEVRQTLTAFSRGLSTLRERGEVVRLVLDTVAETLGAERVALWLLDDGQYRPTESSQKAQTSEVSKTSEVWPAPRGALPAEGDLAAWLAQERRPLVLIPDDHSPQAEDLRQVRATLAVPFLAGDRLLGILTLGEKGSGDLYTQEDLELLTTLAHSATLALENARLHEERMAILRQQLAQVTTAQEEERQRIARELHDGVGPALASLNIRLRTARKLLERDHNLAAGEIEELAELAQANIQDIRRLIHDLRPAALDGLGLVPALREYVARYREEQGLEVALALPEGDGRLAAPLETALFRIVQEALANVAKHAQARRVEVAMTRDRRGVTLRVADDGRGFDPQAPRPGTHLGLWSMRERVEQLGGQFEIESAPGAGTTVRAIIPLKIQESLLALTAQNDPILAELWNNERDGAYDRQD
jgi:signal transduction histidine kinase